MLLKKLLGLGTRFNLVPPGTDPLENPITYKRKKLGCMTWVMILSGLGLAVVLGVKFLGGAKAQQAPTITPTATAAATATPTASLVPTLTGTTTGPVAGAFANVQLPGTARPTGQPTPPGLATVVVIQTKIVVAGGANVEVTRIVQQTALATVLVTATPAASQTPWVVTASPGPTSTPWVIVVEVTREVTQTPSLTPTETATAPVQPTETPTATPTAPGYPYPAP